MLILGACVNFIQDYVIKKETGNNNLYQKLQKLPTANKSDSYFAKSFEAFDFNNLKCKPKNKVNITSDKNKTQETKAIISKSTNKLEYSL
ncbi:CIR protein, fragment [Plasmodium vinckei petteri]|uniref:CIR protein n=1 Tax=Plasmodium vinckei petteri TaxID=138298 RepID=A0A6V7SAH3_PLAVN|nr:CIR protein, fragment [Plasmodium vinckei petteri]